MKTWTLKHGRRAARPHGQDGAYPQPLATPGEQRPEGVIEQEQLDAAREWLRHVEAGRIGRAS
jgi:hypothetical protein